MPMPNVINLENVNKAISQATILSDNHVMIDRYQEELSDVGREVELMPGKDRKSIKKDKVNGPIPLKSYVDFQDKLIEEVIE